MYGLLSTNTEMGSKVAEGIGGCSSILGSMINTRGRLQEMCIADKQRNHQLGYLLDFSSSYGYTSVELLLLLAVCTKPTVLS